MNSLVFNTVEECLMGHFIRGNRGQQDPHPFGFKCDNKIKIGVNF